MDLADIQAAETTLANFTAGGDNFLVETLTVPPNEDKAGMDDDDGCGENARWDKAGGGAMEAFCAFARPDFGAQEAQAHLDEEMIEMDEDDIITATGDGVIKGTTENYGELILNIIGGRRRQSPRAEVKDGDLIEVCGVVAGENEIDLVDPDKHYLRLK